MPRKEPKSVGMRELKTRASEIVGEVREHETVYTVTRRGVAVAALVPIPAAPAYLPAARAGSLSELLSALDDVGRRWRAPESGIELLTRIRR